MDQDPDASSPMAQEESLQDFVRRKVRHERDFTAEALARKQLAERLLKERIVQAPMEVRPGSVVGLRKKGAPVYRGAEETPKKPIPVPLEDSRLEKNVPPVELVAPIPEAVESELAEEETVATITRPRTRAADKLRAFSEIAAKHGDPRNLAAESLILQVATHMKTGRFAVRTFWARTLTQDQKKFLLYGEKGKRITRADEKFSILMRVREELGLKGGEKPRKKELIEAAIGPLGMTPFSAATYVYERLTPEQEAQLDLRTGEPLERQIEVLKRIRKEMSDKGLPPPRQLDLAEAAATELKMTVGSVRALIVDLPQSVKDELDLLQSRSGRLNGLDPGAIREGFIGALAVLKVRRQIPTIKNLRLVLQLKESVLRGYLKEHPDIVELIAKQLTT